MTINLKHLLLLMVSIILPDGKLYADASISISGTVKRAIPVCTVNPTNHILIDFGDKITWKKINENLYKEKIEITANCSDYLQNNMTISIQGDPAGFNPDLVKTSFEGLGVQLYKGNTPIKQGDKITFTYDSAAPNGGVPDIDALLVASDNSPPPLETGYFEGTASIVFLYN